MVGSRSKAVLGLAVTVFVASIGTAAPLADADPTWTQTARISDAPWSEARFAPLPVAIDGDTLVIGASGAVHVYRRSVDDAWAHETTLTPSGEGVENFGTSVAVSGDRIAVGAPGYFVAASAAYVFERSDDGFTEIPLIPEPTDGGELGTFADKIDIDGDDVVLNAVADSLSVYVLHLDSGLQEVLHAPDDDALGSWFGYDVAIDAGVVAVADAGKKVDGSPGVGYVFTPDGTDGYSHEQLVPAPVPTDTAAFSIEVDDGQVAIGSPFVAVDGHDGAGQVSVFTPDGSGYLRTVHDSPAPVVDGRFGFSVALDGGRLVVGEPGDDPAIAGAVHVFDDATAPAVTTIHPTPSTPGDGFGDSVDLDGDRIVVGANSGYAERAVYVFEREPAPLCKGVEATIVGTDGDDTIIGTPGDDVIWAGPGHDHIEGLGGNDLICAGAGNDTILAGAGNDTVYAQNGDDMLFGGTGHDHLLGEAGNDRAGGGDGNDTITGGAGIDHLIGGTGDDLLTGKGSNDTLDGGPGADDLRGSWGNDTLDGGPGPDHIDGGPATDTCTTDPTDTTTRCE